MARSSENRCASLIPCVGARRLDARSLSGQVACGVHRSVHDAYQVAEHIATSVGRRIGNWCESSPEFGASISPAKPGVPDALESIRPCRPTPRREHTKTRPQQD